MKNWKIGARITAGFAAVILVAVALGVFALNRANDIGKKTDELSGNYYPSVLALDRVKANMYHEVCDLLDLIQSSDPKEIARLNAEIAALRADSKKDLDFYATTPFTPEEQAVDSDYEAARADFWKIFEEVQKDGQSTDKVEILKAQQRFTNELKPAYTKYASLGQKLVDMNTKGANAGMDSIHGAVSASTRGVLIGLALAIALSIPITMYIVRGITRHLAQAVDTLQQVAAGDMTASLEIDSKDEVGQMAAALNETVGKLRAALQAVAESANNASASSQELASATDAIAGGAQQQAASLEQTSASIGETSASLEETSASLEEITATIRQTADNARQANQLASSSREAAENGEGVVQGAVHAMSEINAASAKIADIIGTIDEIAFQTNLLAVNAAVEAARAGEDGRGFAVVATEVRTLAQRSAAAAKEIKALIQDSLRKVEKGTDLVNKSGETLHGIVASVKRVTDIVGEIAAAAGEQSTGVEQVNTAMTQVSAAVGQVNTAMSQMDQVTQSNAAQTEELSSTAGSLAEQAHGLQELVSQFTLDERRGSAAPPRNPAPRTAAQRPRAGSRPSAPGARSVVAARGSAPGRAVGAPAKHSAGSALVAAGRPGEDNFEEF